MAGAPLVPRPGQETLDAMLAATLIPAQAGPKDVQPSPIRA
jgi:hypothetical protein